MTERHLNDKTRAAFAEDKAAAFRQELAYRLHRALPDLYPAPPAQE